MLNNECLIANIGFDTITAENEPRYVCCEISARSRPASDSFPRLNSIRGLGERPGPPQAAPGRAQGRAETGARLPAEGSRVSRVLNHLTLPNSCREAPHPFREVPRTISKK